jgi:hypothetical protein
LGKNVPNELIQKCQPVVCVALLKTYCETLYRNIDVYHPIKSELS